MPSPTTIMRMCPPREIVAQPPDLPTSASRASPIMHTRSQPLPRPLLPLLLPHLPIQLPRPQLHHSPILLLLPPLPIQLPSTLQYHPISYQHPQFRGRKLRKRKLLCCLFEMDLKRGSPHLQKQGQKEVNLSTYNGTNSSFQMYVYTSHLFSCDHLLFKTIDARTCINS